jgi:hypothetical protein
VDPSDETEGQTSVIASYAPPGRLAAARVHLSEWLVGIGGMAMLAGLLMPWSGGVSGVGSFSLLTLLVVLVGVAAAAVPVVVSLSSKTDLPIAWETLLADAATLLMFPLLVRLVFPPEDGLEQGFFMVLATSAVMMLACWRSVAREY